jgi:hypothetical protein
MISTANALQKYKEFFDKVGLYAWETTDTHTGPAHDVTWTATLGKYSASAKTLQEARALCALHFLQTVRVRALDAEFFVPDGNIELNPHDVDTCKVQAVDLEWDGHTRQFVCGSVARSDQRVLVFTDFELLKACLSKSMHVVGFAMESDKKYFSALFDNLQVTDVRCLLPAHTFSKTIGLSTALEFYFGLRLNKELQMTFSAQTDITPEQMHYVAGDAQAALQLYFALCAGTRPNIDILEFEEQ